MIYLMHDAQSIGDATMDFVPEEPHNVGEAPRCATCNRFIGMLPWLPPLRVTLRMWGTQFADLLFGSGESLLVSDRLKSLWHAEGLVGLEGFDEVEVVDLDRRGEGDQQPPSYSRVTVVRSNASVDQKQSGLEWEKAPTCGSCRVGDNLKAWSRVVLETPARENVFFARGLPGQIIVDDRFRSFCERHQLRNAHLIPGPDAGHRFD